MICPSQQYSFSPKILLNFPFWRRRCSTHQLYQVCILRYICSWSQIQKSAEHYIYFYFRRIICNILQNDEFLCHGVAQSAEHYIYFYFRRIICNISTNWWISMSWCAECLRSFFINLFPVGVYWTYLLWFLFLVCHLLLTFEWFHQKKFLKTSRISNQSLICFHQLNPAHQPEFRQF